MSVKGLQHNPYRNVYVDGGYLTERVRRKPYSVLLLDEDFHHQVRGQWDELQVGERLKGMGAAGFAAFVVLAGMTGFLRTISPRKPRTTA